MTEPAVQEDPSPFSSQQQPQQSVDVIIPVHNAASTLKETIRSVMDSQTKHNVTVCCYDDGSTDDSLSLLRELQQQYRRSQSQRPLLIATSKLSRGAGYARNRAVELSNQSFLCFLDSDDIMANNRIQLQVDFFLNIPLEQRNKVLLGSHFTRDPVDSTHHYSHWANSLSDDRLMLERYRELTVIQPTWMMTRQRFVELGGYLEAPQITDQDCDGSDDDDSTKALQSFLQSTKCLVHPDETLKTLRVAEDLRLFHQHIMANGTVKVIRKPLVVYRHLGTSQSSRTPRRLLLQLRAVAWQETVLKQQQQHWDRFVIWGAGRDAKNFCHALSDANRQKIYAMVDVDDQKIARGYYRLEKKLYLSKKDRFIDIPILHFSVLTNDRERGEQRYREWKEQCKDEIVKESGPIQKRRDHGSKRLKLEERIDPGMEVVDRDLLRTLPVIVCVAMYRTDGGLEANVKSIGRTEGVDLWHFN